MHFSASASRWSSVLAFSFLIVAVGGSRLIAQTGVPVSSPDGVWTIVENVSFPDGFSPPTEYVAATLDWGALQAILMAAPQEQFGNHANHARLSMPLPDGDFPFFAVAKTLMMERTVADTFQEIETYRFDSVDGPTIAGHILTGMMKFYATGQSSGGLLRVEPVMTADGPVYLSFFDRHRTDGRNEFEHVLDEQPGNPDDRGGLDRPPPGPVASTALDKIQSPALEEAIGFAQASVGDELRTFRFTATTTGEFYQANDTGNGDVDVIISLLQRLIAVNAVFEPEVGVRLILAANTLDVLFDDPTTDGLNDGAAPCSLREANREIAKSVLNDADYDLGFLFSTGSSGGCAWYVVCLTSDDTLHKARGAGHFGANGLGLGTGLLLHEVGHQLGAKHTYSGQASGCNLANFDGDDGDGLPSAWAPGSGSTIMSYSGSCGSDNVDLNLIGAGQYYHTKSFEQIVDNITSGTGSTCGGSINTSNLAPTVIAGPDYTIPRQTPFTLSGVGMDDQPLTFTWEQIDLATTQRPIDTDDGVGPIIRSVPPVNLPTRTIPDIRDLLANVNRAGELLPQVDRTVNFRLTARDNQPGGGGVASDEMVVTTQGAPFFITSPNSGSLAAGCEVPLTWEVGGGSVAAEVSALFSSDGGQNFGTTLIAATPNDGADAFTVPCALGSNARIKLQSVGNIFFDINDEDLTVSNTPPTVNVATGGGSVDDDCQFTVEVSASATDTCGVDAGDVEVELIKGADNFTLGTPTINTQQVSPTEVSVSGSVVVSALMSSPAQLTVSVTAEDACGASTNDTAVAEIIDDTPPTIDVALDPNVLWPPNHKMRPIQATVVASDNCPGASFVLASVVSDEPDNGTGDGDTANDIQDAELGTPDLNFLLRSERMGGGDGRVYTATYTVEDGSGNAAEGSAIVEVPKNQKK